MAMGPGNFAGHYDLDVGDQRVAGRHAGQLLVRRSKAVPYLWHWRDLRPQAMRAAELVGTRQAERRVLIRASPELIPEEGSPPGSDIA
jgi:hypothetical protein